MNENRVPEPVEELLEEAKASFMMHQYSVARKILEMVLEQAPGNRDALYYLAMIHMILRDQDSALRYLHELLERYPSDEAARQLLSRIQRDRA